MILQRKLKHHFLAILMSWSIVLQSMHLEKVARRAILVMCTFVSKYLSALAEAGILHNDFLPELSVLPTSLHFLCTTFTLPPFANNQDPFCYWFLVNLGRTIHAWQNQPLKNRLEIEKLLKDPKWCQKLTLETWNWKVMKNIWSVEHILFFKRLDFQAKSQSWKRRTKR